MKKKLLIFCMIVLCCILSGCGKYGEKDILKNLANNIEKADSYHLTGVLEIINNEDSYSYDVDVTYAKEDNFRVSMKNQTNNHEQIILKNSEGVYVKTQESTKQKIKCYLRCIHLL